MKSFVEKITQQRQQATNEGKKDLALCFKLVGNSSYGRLGQFFFFKKFLSLIFLRYEPQKKNLDQILYVKKFGKRAE